MTTQSCYHSIGNKKKKTKEENAQAKQIDWAFERIMCTAHQEEEGMHCTECLQRNCYLAFANRMARLCQRIGNKGTMLFLTSTDRYEYFFGYHCDNFVLQTIADNVEMINFAPTI